VSAENPRAARPRSGVPPLPRSGRRMGCRPGRFRLRGGGAKVIEPGGVVPLSLTGGGWSGVRPGRLAEVRC
jgi:hypothetical protein